MNADNPMALVEWVQSSMRRYFERDGRLEPVAIVLATRDPKPGRALREPEPVVLPLRFHDARDKDGAAELIRRVARKSEAVAVVCGFETWVLRSDDAKKLEVACKEGIENAPDREEILYCSLERSAGEFLWSAAITRDAANRPCLSSFELDADLEMIPRFHGLLPPALAARFDA